MLENQFTPVETFQWWKHSHFLLSSFHCDKIDLRRRRSDKTVLIPYGGRWGIKHKGLQNNVK